MQVTNTDDQDDAAAATLDADADDADEASNDVAEAADDETEMMSLINAMNVWTC